MKNFAIEQTHERLDSLCWALEQAIQQQSEEHATVLADMIDDLMTESSIDTQPSNPGRQLIEAALLEAEHWHTSRGDSEKAKQYGQLHLNIDSPNAVSSMKG